MTVVYHELLPDSYLLILAPGRDGEPTLEIELVHWLNCARLSGKAAVWVDCGMLHTLSTEAAGLLWTAHRRLQATGVRLVLVHVAERVRKALLARAPALEISIVPTLLDAARQQGPRAALGAMA